MWPAYRQQQNKMHMSEKLQKSPKIAVHFVCSCDKVYHNRDFHFIVFTRSYCHLTIITLIHWIKIDYLYTHPNFQRPRFQFDTVWLKDHVKL